MDRDAAAIAVEAASANAFLRNLGNIIHLLD
jgi:hypothetical protein